MINNYFTIIKHILDFRDNLIGRPLDHVIATTEHHLYLLWDDVMLVVNVGSGKNYVYMDRRIKKLPVPHFKRFISINNAILTDIVGHYNERIVSLYFDNGTILRLFLYQPYSNVLLMDREYNIVDSYFSNKLEKYASLYQQNLHGSALPYFPGISNLSEQESEIIRSEAPGLNQEVFIHEIKSRMSQQNQPFQKVLAGFYEELCAPPACLLFKEEKIKVYQKLLPFIPLHNISDSIEYFDNITDAIRHYVKHVRFQDIFFKKFESMSVILRNEIKYIRNTIKRLRLQIRRAEDKEKFRKTAQIILWNLHDIPEGAKECDLTDFEDPDLKKVTIKLDPNLKPKEFADKLFQKAKRLEDISGLEERIARFKEKQLTLENYLKQVEDATNLKILEELEKKLQQLGLFQQKQTSKEQPERLPYKEFFVDDYIFKVGRSAKDSDILTVKISGKYDWFFHAQNIRGAHVIVSHVNKKSVESLPDHIVSAAAILAAANSDARHSSLVPVQYTQVRYVRKPRKSAAGFVILQQYKTVNVNPSDLDSLNLKTRKELF